MGKLLAKRCRHQEAEKVAKVRASQLQMPRTTDNIKSSMAAPNANDDANIIRGLLGRLSDDIAFISSLFTLQDSKVR